MQDPASPPSVPPSPHSVSPGQGSFHRLASLAQSLDRVATSMGIDQSEIDRRKAFLGLGDRDLQALTTLHRRLKECPTGFVDTFYRHLLAFEETRALLTDQATIERLKRSQAAYFDQLTAGPYDASYVHNRVRVGAVHRQIGLAPKWYLGAYNLYLSELISNVWELLGKNPQDARETVNALVKIVFFDISLTLDTYHHLDRSTIAELQAHADRIVTNIPSGILVLSADLRVLFANRAFLHLAGLALNRVVGLPLEAFFPRQNWWDRVARVYGAGDATSHLEFDYRRESDTRHLRLTLAAVMASRQDDDQHGPDRARLLLVVDDYTDRKQAESALRESQRSFSTLIGNLQGAMYRCANDQDWTVEYISHGIVDLTGYPAEDFMERRVSYGQLVHPADQKRVWQEVQRGVEAKKPFEMAYRLRTAKGDERWIWEQGCGIFSEDGSLLALEGFITDITQRKRSEEALGVIVRGTGGAIGEQFFRSVVRDIAAALHVRWAFVSRVTAPDRSRVKVIAFWTGAAYGDCAEYDPRTMPCRPVLEGEARYYPSGVHEQFPMETWVPDSRVVSYLGVPLLDAAGQVLGHMGVMHDDRMDESAPIQAILKIFAARAGSELERQHTEEALRESEDRYRNLIENAHDIIQSVASDGRFLFVNQAWKDSLGYDETEIPALTLFDVIHPLSQDHCRDQFAELQRGSPAILVQAEFVAKDGRSVLVEGNVTGRYADGRLIATHAIFRNITERREWQARLDHVTSHDHLTGLPNRAVFTDRLNQALVRIKNRRPSRPLAVLMLDLDRFKLVNETLGHATGDQLLLAVAQRLVNCLHDGDTVARFGGDEFGILLPEITKAHDMPMIIEKIFAALKAPFVIDAHELFVTTSIGISIAPDDGDESGALLQNADTAMYRAKDQGRNTYQLYSPAMNVRALERLSLERSLRHALERDEFLVFYQPQVSLKTGLITGMEALVRWQHPELGVVSPAKFIPLAEETGLIVPLGTVVLRTACRQNRSWQEAGLGFFPMAVNLSARQIQQADFTETIAEALRSNGLDPKWLELELTESLLMENTERSMTMLQTLHRMQIGLAIDDFGVGYSSLSYLKRFPITTVKIDRSFVRHVTTAQDDAAIARAIIAMAHSLRLTVVAEGVELPEQTAFLRAEGCDAMQGYLMSPPLPAEEMTALLQRAPRFNLDTDSPSPKAA